MKHAYKQGVVNAQLYTDWRTKLEDFFRSEKYFLNKETITPGMTVLDVGGASGGLGKALKDSIEPTINYTCIDPDAASIALGKEKYPDFTMIDGYFPQDIKLQKYDLVVMMALFPQLPDWKRTVRDLISYSNKYVNFSLLARLDGTTVTDPDLSYHYYLDSGVRVPQIINNVYELVNFLSHHEFRAKKISLYGYHAGKPGHTNRCVPERELIKANIMIELWGVDEDPGQRFGGTHKEVFEKQGIKVYEPEVEIILDDVKVNLLE